MKIFLKITGTGLRPVLAVMALTAIITASCSDNHLIKDSNYRAATEKSFNQRKELAAGRDSALFSVFNRKLSVEESEALRYLYAYMPLSDLADYNGDFFMNNVDASLRARTETAWGKGIPEEIFFHYVLPFRINNENLDSFRIVYYDELINRVKGKDLRDAALEVNHWCHEKVSYQPSDIRTSAPMSTILSARGRCGEESTFTVAALRTIGIPARQVYTPRWAHSDDNHAWVEIWSDGQWYYMGACEPEPVLDRGWFTEPARRAMLVHTKSFGAFMGNENAITINKNFTDVNNLSKYAVTKKIFVKVIDSDNKPVNEASVEFQLYNYAEFYPLAVVPTNEKGISQFETGLGDLLIWAHKGDKFNFKKISVTDTDTLTLKLNSDVSNMNSLDLDLDVPVVRSPLSGPSQELSDQNAKRFNNENLIRQQYIDSWMKPAEAKSLALSLKADTVEVMNIISGSMGNYKEISSFLSGTPDSLRNAALSLLGILPEKDLRDIKRATLTDHLVNVSMNKDVTGENGKNISIEYILNPRIANEIIVPWRHYFLKKLPAEILENGSHDPSVIVKYINDNIKIANEENYYNTPITPVGVNELKVSDNGSRAIYFVAICRSLGIPSRLEPGRNIPQYFINNKWTDVYFSDQKQPDMNKGYIKLHSSDFKPVPEYYIHFTLARFEDGRYNTLEYDYNKKITDFREDLLLPPGHYMLVTGNRLNDSKILSRISFFDLSANEHKTLEVNIRKDASEKKILGQVDLKMIPGLSGTISTSQACVNDRGFVFIWIDPQQEPTKHIFNDLPLLKGELDAWGGKFFFLTEANTSGYDKIKGLPGNTSFLVDNQQDFLKKSIKFSLQPEINLPFVIAADKDGNIFFISSGYRIGIGEQILKNIR